MNFNFNPNNFLCCLLLPLKLKESEKIVQSNKKAL